LDLIGESPLQPEDFFKAFKLMEKCAKPVHKEHRRIALDAVMRGAAPAAVHEWVSAGFHSCSWVCLLISNRKTHLQQTK
jgi:hypothetical protein